MYLFTDSIIMMYIASWHRGAGLQSSDGEFRTCSPGEFVLTGIIAFVTFIVLGSFSLDTEWRNWQELHKNGIADKKEYSKNRFNFF